MCEVYLFIFDILIQYFRRKYSATNVEGSDFCSGMLICVRCRRVTGSVSGMTSYLVAGTEAGESKLAKAKSKEVSRLIMSFSSFVHVRPLVQRSQLPLRRIMVRGWLGVVLCCSLQVSP